MKYMLLIYDEEKNFAKMTQADLGRMYAEYGQFTQEIKTSGNHVASGQLQPVASATSVRIRDGKRMLTDGPFAETREQLGGYYLINAKDLDEAIAIAAKIPSARQGRSKSGRSWRWRRLRQRRRGPTRGQANKIACPAWIIVRSGEWMALTVRTIEYFNTRIQDAPGKAYEILAQLASEEINLLAFSAVPFGPNHVELTIFPDKGDVFQALAGTLGWSMTGPQHACLVQGDDHLGALAEIQKKLVDAGVNIYASSGVTDGNGHFGYVIYFKEGDQEIAAKALGA